MARSCRIAALLMAAVVTATTLAAAQTRDPAPAAATASEPQTREAIRDLVSGLDDRQARALLIERLAKAADQRAAELASEERRDLGDVVVDQAHALVRFLADVIAKAPYIPTQIRAAGANFERERGGRAWGWLPVSVFVSLAGGLGAALLARRSLAALAVRNGTRKLSAAPRRVAGTLRRALVQLAMLLAYLMVAHGLNFGMNAQAPADRWTVTLVISTVGWIGIGVATVRLLLAPGRPDLRLCAADETTVAFLTRRVGIAVALFNIGFGVGIWMDHFGVPHRTHWLGFWVHLAFHALLIATVWQCRRGVSELAAGSTDPELVRTSVLAPWWPTVVTALIALHWLVVLIVVAVSDVPQGLLVSMATTLIAIILIPIIDQWLRAMVEAALPTSPEHSPVLQAAEDAMREGAVRITRVIAFSLIVLGLLRLWNIDIVTLAHQGIGARFASSVINLVLIVAVAYGLWEVVRIVTDRQIAMERVALGLDQRQPAELDVEGEAGGAGPRLGTLLPLVRFGVEIAIVTLAGLAALGELGINIWPLLAGAGVVGIAIGFGAQTLVKDIISGIFFLIDDAFRKGEYIDIGNVKGTVERISLRSMQLRHHNGPLNTVPFGDIRHVTNFSRDWVVMKFSLRLTYDTDAEKVRKMIKKLGQELLDDPELGPKFLQPLKSQGVIEMEESAQIMRIKFMTRPGDQWEIRRVVLARIRELFEAAGIRFASREVVVRVSDSSGERPTASMERAAAGASALRAIEASKPAANPDRC